MEMNGLDLGYEREIAYLGDPNDDAAHRELHDVAAYIIDEHNKVVERLRVAVLMQQHERAN